MIQVLFNDKGKNQIGAIELDVTMEESHERQTEITDHPIETGAYIQDHIVNSPRRLTLTSIVTDTPLGEEAGLRAQAAFDALEELWQSRAPFTVVSGFRVYENMAFESLSMPKTRESALQFVATFKQLTFTVGQVVPISSVRRSDPKLRKGNVSNPDKNANGANVGRQTPKAATPEQERSTSVLKSIIGGD